VTSKTGARRHLSHRHEEFLRALARKDGEEAMRQLKETLNERPDLGGKYCGVVASLLAQQGQLEMAVRLYRDAIEFDPHDTLARLYLGIALQKLGRLQEANEEWEWIGANHPERPEAALQLALAHLANGDWQAGESAISAAMEQIPSGHVLRTDANLVFRMVQLVKAKDPAPAATDR
jgi:Flp pilus assembly protein TadD